MSLAGDVPLNVFGVELDDACIDELYRWLDTIPMSRPRKALNRDFSDGVLAAELIAHFLPRYVDLHQYMPASSHQLKRYNWQTLNKMVMPYLEMQLSSTQVEALITCQQGTVESFLHLLRPKIELAITEKRFRPRRRGSRLKSAGSNTSLNQSESETENESRIGTPRRTRRYLTSLQRIGISAVPIAVSDHSIPSISTPNGDPPKINGDASSTDSHGAKMYQDLVPGRLLHAAQCELYAKDEQITALQARVRHLQRLTALKDDRITQLTQRLDRLAEALNERIQAAQPMLSADEQKTTAAQSLLNQLMDLRSSLTPSTNASDGDD